MVTVFLKIKVFSPGRLQNAGLENIEPYAGFKSNQETKQYY